MSKHALLVVALGVPLSTALGQAMKPAAKPAVIIAVPDQVTWGAAPAVLPAGAKLAVLEGNPMKAGAYTMRLQMPDGYKISPHFHPGPEHVTIVSGSLMVGMGKTADESQMKAFPTGTFAMIPPRTPHYVKAQGETVLQLHGIGPWQLIYVNKADDPRSKAAAN
jgi:quercetin dioxygenase-like cupin family protein